MNSMRWLASGLRADGPATSMATAPGTWCSRSHCRGEVAPVLRFLGEFDRVHAVGEGQSLADGRIAAHGDNPHRRIEARDHPRRGAGPRGHEHGGARHGLQRVLHDRGNRFGRRRRALACGRTRRSPLSRVGGRCASVEAAIFASIATASSGYLPIADSPESMMQSVPSRMALATSVASARVGRRLDDHGFEHLRGGDDRLAREAGLGDELLLQDGHFLDRHFHAEVAARHHDAVRRLQDFVEVLERVRRARSWR